MSITGLPFYSAEADHTHVYLWPPVFQILHSSFPASKPTRFFDLGCGAGAFANALSAQGFNVTGVDPSPSGIENARKAYPHLQLEIGSTEEDLAGRFGKFQAVISLEVVEHVFSPRPFASRIYDLLEPGGVAIISTPYNGYLKNLAVALLGKYDKHYTALWDNGHIKFWSMKTLAQLLREAGFEDIQFKRVGRIPPLAKSMIAIARKPK
jgi:2-polyprenyl-6-hydroxyphenyl methylase/3-demethylubiquinone-9 3-methyltransferase